MTVPRPVSAQIQAFFTERLLHQQQASKHTIAAYRDTFRLFLRYTQAKLRKSPGELTITDLTSRLIAEFLSHLEKERHNKARTRNARRSALRSFFRFLAVEEPAHSYEIQRVLAIPAKPFSSPPIDWLTRDEVDRVLASPDLETWGGRRDHALMHLMIQTGLRVSEVVDVRPDDLRIGTGASVHCRGKGRKERVTPLFKETSNVIRRWLREEAPLPNQPLFCSARGAPLSTDGVRYILAKHVAQAGATCPSLAKKRVSPHVLRHTTAMHLLMAGVDITVIALWLGHESIETTRVYVSANLELKQRLLSRLQPPRHRRGNFRPSDQLIGFLNGL